MATVNGVPEYTGTLVSVNAITCQCNVFTSMPI